MGGVIVAGAVWAVLVAIGQVAVRSQREDPDWLAALWVARLYCRLVQRARYIGRSNLPARGPYIIVVNHTAGVDPVLVQAASEPHIRWLMLSEMAVPGAAAFWRWLDVIFVSQSGRDIGAVRRALRHLSDGGVIGIFPEGAIERPARTLRKFASGVGLIVAKAGVPVVPIVIEGTPHALSAWASLLRMGRAVVRIMPPVSFPASAGAAAIAAELEAMYQGWTGWPVVGQDQRAPDACDSMAASRSL